MFNKCLQRHEWVFIPNIFGHNDPQPNNEQIYMNVGRWKALYYLPRKERTRAKYTKKRYTFMFSGRSSKMTVTYLGGNITDLAILFWGSWYESNILFALSSFVLAN